MKRNGLLMMAAMVLAAVPNPSGAADAPPNDGFANATEVSVPTTVHSALTGATTDPGEPVDCSGGNTVWYRFSLDTPAPLLVTSVGWGSAAALYRGSTIDALTRLACTRESGRASVLLDAGDYLVQVGRYSAALTHHETRLFFGFATGGSANAGAETDGSLEGSGAFAWTPDGGGAVGSDGGGAIVYAGSVWNAVVVDLRGPPKALAGVGCVGFAFCVVLVGAETASEQTWACGSVTFAVWGCARAFSDGSVLVCTSEVCPPRVRPGG